VRRRADLIRFQSCGKTFRVERAINDFSGAVAAKFTLIFQYVTMLIA
jgi:hypothetical protein